MTVPHNPDALRCHHGLRRQTIVQSLLADVFQGRLRAGGHLVTQELAVRFGVSHTPIREALIALAGIGIIDLIAESCGNRFLAQELSRLKTLFRAFRDVSWQRDEARNDYHRLAEESGEHLAIVEALLANDAKLAGRAMARHIRSGVKYWSRA